MYDFADLYIDMKKDLYIYSKDTRSIELKEASFDHYH